MDESVLSDMAHDPEHLEGLRSLELTSYVCAPILARGKVMGAISLGTSESRRHYQIALWIIVPSSVLGLLVMLGLMRSFYAWVFNPIRDLEKGVSSLAQGRFAHVIEINAERLD